MMFICSLLTIKLENDGFKMPYRMNNREVAARFLKHYSCTYEIPTQLPVKHLNGKNLSVNLM